MKVVNILTLHKSQKHLNFKKKLGGVSNQESGVRQSTLDILPDS